MQGLSGRLDLNYDVIANIDDDGYDFYIAYLLPEFYRNNLHKPGVLGEAFAGYYENITIPKQRYAVFETERCTYPTTVSLGLRRRVLLNGFPLPVINLPMRLKSSLHIGIGETIARTVTENFGYRLKNKNKFRQYRL